MNTYTVIFPDGNSDTRKTEHEYGWAVLINIGEHGWFAKYSKDEKNAKKIAKSMLSCPASKYSNVEVEVIELAKVVI
jgi:hypothetical protein